MPPSDSSRALRTRPLGAARVAPDPACDAACGPEPGPPITFGGAPTITAGFDITTPPPDGARVRGCVDGVCVRVIAGGVAVRPIAGGVTARGTAACPGCVMPGNRCGCGGPGTVGARGPGVGGRARTTSPGRGGVGGGIAPEPRGAAAPTGG